MAETRRDRFLRLANQRVNRALKTLSLIGNLSVRSNYDYREDDVRVIFKALEDELKAVKARFDNVPSKRKDTFRLK